MHNARGLSSTFTLDHHHLHFSQGQFSLTVSLIDHRSPMEHDASDLLGQNTMPNASGARTGFFSLSLGQSIGTAVVVIALYTVGLRLWRRVLLWRERSYKL